MKRNEEKRREMQFNAVKCREMKRNEEQCREMQRKAEVVVALPNEETNQMVVFISAFGHGGQTRPRLGKMNISTMHQMMLIKDCGLFLYNCGNF